MRQPWPPQTEIHWHEHDIKTNNNMKQHGSSVWVFCGWLDGTANLHRFMNQNIFSVSEKMYEKIHEGVKLKVVSFTLKRKWLTLLSHIIIIIIINSNNNNNNNNVVMLVIVIFRYSGVTVHDDTFVKWIVALFVVSIVDKWTEGKSHLWEGEPLERQHANYLSS